jgi:hypothetical protein
LEREDAAVKVSRREFVSTATCAAAASLCALPSSALAASSSPTKVEPRFTLLNLESNCALPESLAGTQAALGDSHHSVLVSEFDLGRLASGLTSLCTSGRLVIIPAAGAVKRATFGAVAELLDAGATVLWESGAAFINSADFAQQQAMTEKYFGISIAQPVHVWWQSNSPKSKSAVSMQNARSTRAIGHEQIPYVAYRWPLQAHVRDFSRVIQVSAASGHAIAHWGEAPVAWRKKVGAGSLIFLGSPLGPALGSGDTEANTLFQSITSKERVFLSHRTSAILL